MRKEYGITSTIAIIAIVCIVIASVGTYFFVSNMKQAEIDNLKNNYNTEKNNYEGQITNLNNQINDLEKTLNEDNQNYVKNMVDGLRNYSNGDYYYGGAISYTIEADDYYSLDSFYTAYLYYLSASWFYDWAAQNYSTAKTYFDEAIQYAPNNKTQQIVELYSSISKIYSDAFTEYSKVLEDLSNACYSYDEGDYTTGGLYIDMSNDHLEDYNDLIEPLADLENDLKLLLEDFTII